VSAFAACDKKRERASEPSSATDEAERRRETILSSARIESRDYVANRIAEVRCQRESTCMDVGPGRRFSSKEACMSEHRKDSLEHLNRTECSHGVDPRALEQCLGAIRNEVCPRILEELEHLPECRDSNICFRGDAP
jgi:hypothetical protein